MRYRFTYLAVAVLLAATAAPLVRAESVSLISVDNLTKQQYLRMAELGLEVIEARADRVQMLAWPNDIRPHPRPIHCLLPIRGC